MPVFVPQFANIRTTLAKMQSRGGWSPVWLLQNFFSGIYVNGQPIGSGASAQASKDVDWG